MIKISNKLKQQMKAGFLPFVAGMGGFLKSLLVSSLINIGVGAISNVMNMSSSVSFASRSVTTTQEQIMNLSPIYNSSVTLY